MNPAASPERPVPPNENGFGGLLLNLAFNIVIPSLILSKLSGDTHLGVKWALLTAIAFPFLYGLKDFRQRHKINFFSALGLFNVLMTGGIGLLKLDAQYLAIKEAAVPALFGIATLVSLKTQYPLINTLIFNEMVLNVEKIKNTLHARGHTETFNGVTLKANYIVAASFFLSSFLNYTLARLIVTSPAGTEAFNRELGKMTALSYPVIAVPSMLVLMVALWYLFHNIQRLTELEFEDILKHPPTEKKS